MSEQQDTRRLTANELVNVKDIKGNFLYSRDGYLFGYLQFLPYNIDLLSREEKKQKTDTLSQSYDGDRKNFVYMSLPRELDLDEYKNFLTERYQAELDSIGKRNILRMMMNQAQRLSTSGLNYEHQHYMKLWTRIGKNPNDARYELMTRLEEMRDNYEAAGIVTKILEEHEIIKLCNLFANSRQASLSFLMEENVLYEAITQIRE